jgi:ferredoxin
MNWRRCSPRALLLVVAACQATAPDEFDRETDSSAMGSIDGRVEAQDAPSDASSLRDGSVELDAAEFPAEAARSTIADKPTITIGNGDLWPSCWSDDDNLYAAWGDGSGFGTLFAEIGVARITGNPRAGNMEGENLATDESVGPLWGSG